MLYTHSFRSLFARVIKCVRMYMHSSRSLSLRTRFVRGCIVACYNSQTHETTTTCTNWSHAYVVNMGRLTIHERLRVITLFSRGHSVSSIRERLAEENVSISLKGLYNLLKKYREKQIILSRLTPSKKASDNWHTAICTCAPFPICTCLVHFDCS